MDRADKRTAATFLVACLAVLAAPFTAPSVEAQEEEGDELIGYTVGYAEDPGHPTGAGAQGGVLLAIDLLTGETTPIGQTGQPYIEGLTFAPDGTLYGVDATVGALVTIDLSTGTSTTVGDVTSGYPGGLTFDCAGTLWLTADTTLYEVDPETAHATYVKDLGEYVSALTVSGDTLFGVWSDDEDGGQRKLVTVDTTDPRITVVGDIEEVWPPVGLSFAPDGALWGVTNDQGSPIRGPRPVESAFTLDPTTGSATVHSQPLANGRSLAIPGGGYFCPGDLGVPAGGNSTGAPDTLRSPAGDNTASPTGAQATGDGTDPAPGRTGTWTVADRAPAGKGVSAGSDAGSIPAAADPEGTNLLADPASSDDASSGATGPLVAGAASALILGLIGWRRWARSGA